ncbi:hypothetical protein Tcan_01071, partial [Toxocara canis]
ILPVYCRGQIEILILHNTECSVGGITEGACTIKLPHKDVMCTVKDHRISKYLKSFITKILRCFILSTIYRAFRSSHCAVDDIVGCTMLTQNTRLATIRCFSRASSRQCL